MCLEFFPLRLEFIARDLLHFPRGKAGNILRGAFGTILQRLDSSHYQQLFRPTASRGVGPSGLVDRPRPFVFRASHLDGRTIAPGEAFHFDINLFLDAGPSFLQVFEELAREGLGPGRAKVDLTRPVIPSAPVWLNLAPLSSAPSRIRVEFLTPTELKRDGGIAERPEFPILLARIRDRISTLRALYGAGPLDIDFAGSNARAASVATTRCDIEHYKTIRHSARTGQSHSIGGFTGSADYEGDFAEFLPYLEAARHTGVGRHAVWGNGEIIVEGQSAWQNERNRPKLISGGA